MLRQNRKIELIFNVILIFIHIYIVYWCCCLSVNEYNIETQTLIRPILYSSRPIRLQIFHIFCTFAIMAFKICTFLTFKNLSNKDIGHYAKGYGNQFDTIYFYLHSRFLTLLNLFHDSSCKIFSRLKCYKDILKDVSKGSASIFAFYFFRH